MSGFTSQQLEKRLAELNSSAQTIQTFSLWLIHHRKHHKTIVQTWFKELKKAPQNRKLTFMYLANDVIQNSRKKGPEFTKEFASALKAAFTNVSKECDEKTWRGLDRILSVWAERNIYDANQIGEFKKAIGPRKDSKAKENAAKSAESVENREKVNNNNDSNNNTNNSNNNNNNNNNNDSGKNTTSGNKKNDDSPAPDAKRLKLSHKAATQKTNTSNVSNSYAKKAFDKLKSTLDKPNPNETDKLIDPESLILALQNLDSSPSSDACVRERIASLPTEVSDPTLLKKIRDKDAAERLSRQVDEACTMLAEYNTRLAQELEERKRVSSLLSNFIKNQKDSLEQTESKLAEYKDRLVKVSRVRDVLTSHLQNLPDLSLLPSVSGGLAPLPSAGDLFSIAAGKSLSKSSLGSNSSASPNTASPADEGYTPQSVGTPNSGNEDSHSRG